METQLKQRLTGAILLVVIAVLAVPELLTGPREPAAAAPVVNDAAPIRSYTIDLTGATPPRVTRPPGESPPAAAPTAPRAATGAPAAGTAAGNADGRSSPLPMPTTSAPAAASPTAAAAPVTAAHTAAPTPTAAATPRAAPDTAAGAAAAPPVSAAAAAQSFAVQLGSYANRDTVTKLTASLRSAGFKVSVAQVRAGGKELQRVRVGPVSNRAAAEALQARLAAAGHKGPIVPFP